MGYLVNRRLRVDVSPGGEPQALHLGSGRVEVSRITETWRDVGSWWCGEREKVFYRLECEEGILVEIYRETRIPGGAWMLYRIYD